MNTFRSVILEAVKSEESNLNFRDRIALRLVLRFKPDTLAKEILKQAQAESIIPAEANLKEEVGSFDFTKLLEFIKEILPILLKLISLFP